MEGVRKKNRPFRYEACWGKRKECNALISNAWNSTLNHFPKLQETTNGLKRCKKRFMSWSKATFKNQKGLINAKLSKIKLLQEANIGNCNESISTLKKEVDKLLEEEDISWKQRAKQDFTSPKTLLKQTTQKLQDLKMLNYKAPKLRATDSENTSQWEAPPQDFYKINLVY